VREWAGCAARTVFEHVLVLLLLLAQHGALSRIVRLHLRQRVVLIIPLIEEAPELRGAHHERLGERDGERQILVVVILHRALRVALLCLSKASALAPEVILGAGWRPDRPRVNVNETQINRASPHPGIVVIKNSKAGKRPTQPAKNSREKGGARSLTRRP